MTPPAATVRQGDVRDMLATLPERHYQCAVFSPPYWSLRSYLPADHPLKPQELGSENVHDCLGWATGERCGVCFICHLVAVLDGVRRVLRDDGTVFVNLGDSYTSGNRATYRSGASDNKGHRVQDGMPRALTPNGLKPKDLCGVPWRFALAMQAAGWWWRSVIVWQKPSCMPSSVRDRPTTSWEPLLLFSKSARYFWDQCGVRENGGNGWHGSAFTDERDASTKNRLGMGDRVESSGRNLRDVWAIPEDDGPVWTIAAEPTKAAHYAAFPTELARRCIRCGTSRAGCCPTCRTPWERVMEKSGGTIGTEHAAWTAARTQGGSWSTPADVRALQRSYRIESIGHRPACTCPPADAVPCAVLDPFCGTGRSGVAALELGCDFTGIDLNADYVALARDQIAQAHPLLVAPDQGGETVLWETT